MYHVIPRSTVDPWPRHKGHESESDRRADGAKSNAATVAMSSTILFKTAITNCRALLLYDDGAGTRSRITRKDGEVCPKHDSGITAGGLKMEFILLSLTPNSERCNGTTHVASRSDRVRSQMSSFKPYSHLIFTKRLFHSTRVEA